jgi:hypothetical protein
MADACTKELPNGKPALIIDPLAADAFNFFQEAMTVLASLPRNA